MSGAVFNVRARFCDGCQTTIAWTSNFIVPVIMEGEQVLGYDFDDEFGCCRQEAGIVWNKCLVCDEDFCDNCKASHDHQTEPGPVHRPDERCSNCLSHQDVQA